MSARSRLALLLAAAVYLVAWAFGSKPLYPIAVGLALAAVGAWAWTRLAAGPMQLRRSAGRGEHIEGDDVWVRLELERGSRFPTGWLVVHERLSRLGTRETKLRGDGYRLHGEYVLAALPRGRYEVEHAEVAVEDPFGLEEVRVAVDAPGALVVYPRLSEIGELFSESGRHAQDGRRLLLRRPSGFDLHSVREYEQGESLRKVHWRSTARRGQLMVKELEDAPRDEIVVLLDCDARGQAGEPPDSAFDAGVRVAGSILRTYARRGRRSVLATNGARPLVARVSSIEGDWRAALEVLAAAEPDGRHSVAELVGRESGIAARALELVVVTARLDPRLVDRLVQRALTHHGVSVVWIDAPSFAGRTGGRENGLLRLAAAGVAVAVVRQGDDVGAALSARLPRKAAHA